MVRVFLATNLQSFTEGVEEIEVEVSSVKSLIAELDRRYPGIAEALKSGFAVADDAGISVYPNEKKCVHQKRFYFLDFHFTTSDLFCWSLSSRSKIGTPGTL